MTTAGLGEYDGEYDGNAPADWGELVGVRMSRYSNDQGYASEPAQARRSPITR
jgi:hypothetical protein